MPQFSKHQQVVVTVTDTEGLRHHFDGFVVRTDLRVNSDMSRPFHQHVPVDPSPNFAHREWMVVDSPSGEPYQCAGVEIGPDHQFTGTSLWVCPTGASVEVSLAGPEAQARVDKDLSPQRVFDAMLARFAAVDPEAARRMADAVGDLVDAAYGRGSDAGWEAAGR